MFVDEDFAIDCKRRSPLHRASSPGVLFRQIVEGTAGVAFRSGARHMTHLPAPSVPFADRQEGRLPGWLTRWRETLHAYAHYAGARPRLFFLLPPGAGWLASAILVIAVLWISWQWRDSDLLFAIGFSVAAFQVDVSFPDLQRGPALACGALVTVAARAETPQSAIHLASGLLMDRAGQRMGIRSRNPSRKPLSGKSCVRNKGVMIHETAKNPVSGRASRPLRRESALSRIGGPFC